MAPFLSERTLRVQAMPVHGFPPPLAAQRLRLHCGSSPGSR